MILRAVYLLMLGFKGRLEVLKQGIAAQADDALGLNPVA